MQYLKNTSHVWSLSLIVYKKPQYPLPLLCHTSSLSFFWYHFEFTTHNQMSTLPQTQGQTIQDAWDCKGSPAERSKTGGWTSSAMILGICYDINILTKNV